MANLKVCLSDDVYIIVTSPGGGRDLLLSANVFIRLVKTRVVSGMKEIYRNRSIALGLYPNARNVPYKGDTCTNALYGCIVFISEGYTKSPVGVYNISISE